MGNQVNGLLEIHIDYDSQMSWTTRSIQPIPEMISRLLTKRIHEAQEEG